MGFLIFLISSAFYYSTISAYYLSEISSDTPTGECNLSADICRLLFTDFYVFGTMLWCILNAFWVIALLIQHLLQISWQLTTNEVLNRHKYAYLAHPDDQSKPAYQRRRFNPFDFGPIENCLSFWGFKSKLSHISWFSQYAVPFELEQRARQKKNGYESI
jgi:hypothetical protein